MLNPAIVNGCSLTTVDKHTLRPFRSDGRRTNSSIGKMFLRLYKAVIAFDSTYDCWPTKQRQSYAEPTIRRRCLKRKNLNDPVGVGVIRNNWAFEIGDNKCFRQQETVQFSNSQS